MVLTSGVADRVRSSGAGTERMRLKEGARSGCFPTICAAEECRDQGAQRHRHAAFAIAAIFAIIRKNGERRIIRSDYRKLLP